MQGCTIVSQRQEVAKILAEKIRRFDMELELFRTKWFSELKDGDPYYNRNLTLDAEKIILPMFDVSIVIVNYNGQCTSLKGA